MCSAPISGKSIVLTREARIYDVLGSPWDKTRWCVCMVYCVYICTSVSGGRVYVFYICTSACDRPVCIFLCTCFCMQVMCVCAVYKSRCVCMGIVCAVYIHRCIWEVVCVICICTGVSV